MLLAVLLALAFVLVKRQMGHTYMFDSPSMDRSLIVNEGCIMSMCYLDVVIKERTSLFWFSSRPCNVQNTPTGRVFMNAHIIWDDGESKIAWGTREGMGYIDIERNCPN